MKPSQYNLDDSSNDALITQQTKKKDINRKYQYIFIAVALLVTVIILSLYFSKQGVFSEDPSQNEIVLPSDPLERARELLKLYPLIDGHNDLPWQYRKQFNDSVFGSVDLRQDNSIRFQTDIPRLRQGGMGAQFWSVYMDCETTQYSDAVRTTMEQIDVVYKMVERYPSDFALALTADDIQNAFNKGQIGSLIGIEGGHSVDSSLGALRQFYKLGARYMTLTHNCNTPWADSAAQSPEHNGLSDFGVSLVHEMNRLGMLVDLSHVSNITMKRVLEVAVAPVYFSHSSAYALCPVPRNVPDDVLELLKTNGGVVSVTFVNSFIRCDGAQSNISDVADHIDHIVQVAGIDHVGIGGDYDGVDALPTGLTDVSGYPNLFAELIRRGYSDEDIIKVAGGNTLRVLRQAEEVARTLSSAENPGESVIFPNVSCRTFS